MEGIKYDGEGGHLFVGDLASGRIEIGVELALHRESSFGGGSSNQFQDHRVAGERLATPVLTDPGKRGDAQSCSTCSFLGANERE
jgi:hypothetical protein